MNTPLITLVTRHQVAQALPLDTDPAGLHLGVIAGLLAASQQLLTPTEFQHLVTACDIDPTQLAELLAITAADPDATTEENQPAIDV